jgi:hypothetical protein
MRLKDGRDHGIATLFLEIAREDLQTGATPSGRRASWPR